MTLALIHGVPDTHRVWRPLTERLGRDDAIALSLPGFGTPAPDGFTSTKEEYVAWLIAALEALPAPRDAIAHDWGSLLLVRVLSLRPDLIRSWVGGGCPVTSDYTWHQTARIWQTPSAGEKLMRPFEGELAAKMLMRSGVPADQAAEAARHIDPPMRAAILSLYRSGTDVFRQWEGDLARIGAPGLVLWGETDAYAPPHYAVRMGEMTGARVVVLPCGHWWQCELPDQSADIVKAFWRDNAIA
jgi:pimeloyl-ACP methyl ester carboxylesterase